MAQKTSFGVSMCLLIVRSVKIEDRPKRVEITKIWLCREIPAKTKTSENTMKLCYLAKYTNCNETLNLTQIETKKCVQYYLYTYTLL